MKTASQFAEELKAIFEDTDAEPGDESGVVPVPDKQELGEEIADWRGPLQDIQTRLRRMITQDIDKFMESAQKITQRAEESDWSKTVIQNEVARWSRDVNKVYADFKNSTKGFQDLVKAMGIPMRRHSTKGKAPAKRGKMDWSKLTQVQLKREVQQQVKRLSAGIHSLADDGAFMLHQIDRILKYKAPKDETIREEIGALYQDFVDFRNAFGSKVWGPYNGLIGRLGAIPSKPIGKYGAEYSKTMRQRPGRMTAGSDLPIDCPELREAIERDRLRATRGVLGEDQEEAAAIIEGIEYELLGEGEDLEEARAQEVFFDSHGGPWMVCPCSHQDAKAFGPAGCARELAGPQWRHVSKSDIYNDPDTGFDFLKPKAVKKYRKFIGESGDLGSESIETELLGEADDPEKGVARKMKAKGYDYKILLKKGPPLYTKTANGARDVQKDYPGSKIVANESGEIDDPALIEAAEHGDLFDFFEDFDSLIWGDDDELAEEDDDRPFDLAEKRFMVKADMRRVGGPSNYAGGWARHFGDRNKGVPVDAPSADAAVKKFAGENNLNPFYLMAEADELTEMSLDPEGMRKAVQKAIRGSKYDARTMMLQLPDGRAIMFSRIGRDPGRSYIDIWRGGKKIIGDFEVRTPSDVVKKISLEEDDDRPFDLEELTEDELTEMSQVVKTIFQQMGGGRSMMMIGGQAMEVDGNTLGIKWPSRHRARIGNYVEIRYVPGVDLYDMEFFNVSAKGKKTVKKFKRIYNDMLVDTFENHTHWYMRL